MGREISEEHPVLDARLPNGFRVHAMIPPSARTGTYLTIRKFTREVLTLDDLIGFGSLSEAAKEFLEICVRLRKNMLISGGTGTGKTVLLGAISRAIPEEERIVVIEDTSELRLIQRHCLYLEAQHADRAGRGGLNVRQLFVNSLRMRPDRIIVGEVRGGEALDMIQSMISGHAGALSTIHANTPAGRPDPAGNPVADVRRGDSGLRGPGAGGLGNQPDRADRPVYRRRLAKDHANHGGRRAGRR